MIRRANHIAIDGTTVSATFGRNQIACVKAAYGDKVETAALSEMGSQRINVRSRGSYTTDEFSITFEETRFRAEFTPLLQRSGFANEMIPIVIGVFHPDLGSDSDLLEECRLLSISNEYENSNAVKLIETKWSTNQIYWTEARITINQRDLSQPLSASKFT